MLGRKSSFLYSSCFFRHSIFSKLSKLNQVNCETARRLIRCTSFRYLWSLLCKFRSRQSHYNLEYINRQSKGQNLVTQMNSRSLCYYSLILEKSLELSCCDLVKWRSLCSRSIIRRRPCSLRKPLRRPSLHRLKRVWIPLFRCNRNWQGLCLQTHLRTTLISPGSAPWELKSNIPLCFPKRFLHPWTCKSFYFRTHLTMKLSLESNSYAALNY